MVAIHSLTPVTKYALRQSCCYLDPKSCRPGRWPWWGYQKREEAAMTETRRGKRKRGGLSAQEGAWSVDALIVPTQTQEWL